MNAAREPTIAAERDPEPHDERASRLTVVPEHPPGKTAPDNTSEPHVDPERGVLLAVCGLCGGAGASTLAYLVALAQARRSSEAVLVCDTGGPGGGISRCAGVQAPRSLVEVADHVAAGLPVGRLFTATAGLRVLATGPRFTPACAPDGIELVLAFARERYPLTVIDCGTLARQADQVALAHATRIAWVLPASTSGVRRARPVLEAINPYLPGRELIVARHDGARGPLRELKTLAADRHAPLMLLPALPDLAGGDPSQALEAAQVTLQAILGALQR